MSIQSRARNPKRPTRYSRPLFPGPDKDLIPTKAIRLFRSDSESHNYEPHGKFSGITTHARQRRNKARESLQDLKAS